MDHFKREMGCLNDSRTDGIGPGMIEICHVRFFPLLRRRGCSNVSVLNNHCSHELDLLGALSYNVGRVFDRLNHPVPYPVQLPCCNVDIVTYNRFSASIPLYTVLCMLQRLDSRILRVRMGENDSRTMAIAEELSENHKVRIFPPMRRRLGKMVPVLSNKWCYGLDIIGPWLYNVGKCSGHYLAYCMQGFPFHCTQGL